MTAHKQKYLSLVLALILALISSAPAFACCEEYGYPPISNLRDGAVRPGSRHTIVIQSDVLSYHCCVSFRTNIPPPLQQNTSYIEVDRQQSGIYYCLLADGCFVPDERVPIRWGVGTAVGFLPAGSPIPANINLGGTPVAAGGQIEEDIAAAKRRVLLNILMGRVRANPAFPKEHINHDNFQIKVKADAGGGRRASIDVPALGLSEASPAYFADFVTFPQLTADDAKFTYAFMNIGDGDWLDVVFDGQVVWSSFGLMIEPEVLYTATLDPALLSNKTGYMAVTLHSVGQPNAIVVLPDELFGPAVAAVPTISKWMFILLGLLLVGGAAIHLQRRAIG